MQAYSDMEHECIIIVYVSCVIHVFNCIPIDVCRYNMLLMCAASLGSTVQLKYKDDKNVQLPRLLSSI